MKHKLYSRTIIDILLTIILLLQMAYMLIGEVLHEWLGIVMFLLFIIHLFLNHKWIKNILKGKYSLFRVFQTAINLCVFICMVLLMISGIMLSKYVFTFLPISGGMSVARILHMSASYWGFLFMSIHLGFHWSMILNIFIKKKQTKVIKSIIGCLGFILFLCGIYYFHEQNIASYLFFKNQFVFFDTNISLFSSIMQYIMIMGTFTYIGHQIKKCILKQNKRKR